MTGMNKKEREQNTVAAATETFNKARLEVEQLLRGKLPRSAVNGSIQQAGEFKKLLARADKLPKQASGEFANIAMQTRKLRKFISEWQGFDSAKPQSNKEQAA